MTLTNAPGFGRRRFLHQVGIGMAALASSGLRTGFGAASDAPVVLGSGNHRYEWVRGWGALPSGLKYGSTHGGVVIDSQSHIYFSTDGDLGIVVLDRDGKYVRSFGKEWKPDRDGNGTHDMQLHKVKGDEFIFLVSLFRHEFAKITPQGSVVWVRGFPEKSGLYKAKEEFRPTGITVAPNGDVYVTDGYGLNYIHHYSGNGEYQNSWGGKSTTAKEDGKFATPHKITIDRRAGGEPLVMVTDRANHRLQWFTLAGKHVKTVDGSANDFLRLPSVLSIRESEVAIGDLAGRVTILDKSNKLVAQLGDSGDEKKRSTNKIPPEQWVDGQFIACHGLTWDKNGDIYVSEYSLAGRVVKLKKLKAQT